MIKSVWITNQNGDTLELDLRRSGEDLGLLIFNLEGLGAPKANVSGDGGPGFDGVRDTLVVTDPRSITLTLAVQGQGESEEDAKALIYEYFPIKQEVVFGVITDRNEVYIPAIIESAESNQFAKVENWIIGLYCPSPYFRDIDVVEVAISEESGIPTFEFPFSNESLWQPQIIFGYVTVLPTAVVNNVGSVTTGAIFSMWFNGYVERPVIANSNGGQRMEIDLDSVETYYGTPVEADDQLIINTKFGEKSAWYVRDGDWFNIINGVGLDEDWIQINPGKNLITVTATDGQELIETDVRFQPLLEGI